MHPLAIVGGVVLQMALGMIWYGPLMFQDAFALNAFGNTKELKPIPAAIASTVVGPLISTPIFLFVMDVANAHTALLGLGWGILFGLMLFSTQLMHGLFEMRPIALQLIHQGYHAVAFALIGVLYGAFA
uniref:DUF1761 domain-containing protein n=1 Tax=Rhodosorus marinus TaxID=101924 RepID=A0A7S3EH83_9RHOD|mmetsp:Transcript_33590/g.132502  ORF Transcript_33590/g.132502 Transcript_33590/m.132502 type:complete len:129 (+) Transcript_33590:99-485(+)